MAKLSDKIDLSGALKQAGIAVGFEPAQEDPVESLLESGVKAHKGRKKKEKESQPSPEAKAAEENSLFAELIPKEPDGKQEEKWPKTYEETCEYDLRRAHERGYPDPDFDFRRMYAKGQRMWFVRILAPLGEKEIIEVILGTIYPRTIVAVQPKAFCHCIGYNMRDQLFNTPREAQDYYDSVQVSSRYKTERPMKRQEDDDDYDEDGIQSSQESLDVLMNEEVD